MTRRKAESFFLCVWDMWLLLLRLLHGYGISKPHIRTFLVCSTSSYHTHTHTHQLLAAWPGNSYVHTCIPDGHVYITYMGNQAKCHCLIQSELEGWWGFYKDVFSIPSVHLHFLLLCLPEFEISFSFLIKNDRDIECQWVNKMSGWRHCFVSIGHFIWQDSEMWLCCWK